MYKHYITQSLLDYIFSIKHIYDRMNFIDGTEITCLLRNGYLVKVRYRNKKHRGSLNCRYPLLLFSKYRNCNVYMDVDRIATTTTFEYIKGGIDNGDCKLSIKGGANRTNTSI